MTQKANEAKKMQRAKTLAAAKLAEEAAEREAVLQRERRNLRFYKRTLAKIEQERRAQRAWQNIKVKFSNNLTKITVSCSFRMYFFRLGFD